MTFRLSHFLGLALLALAVLASAPAAADTACGHQLSDPVMAKWQAMGGAKGALGCPTGDESVTATSQAGTRARQADFAGGMILWHASGPRAGQTFAVTGCAFRLYFQYGGASGWLGLPTADAVNTPDGQRQSFEGGRVTYLRAPNDCGAERSAEMAAAAPPAAAAAPPLPDTSPLDAFFDPARGDHLTAAAASTARTAVAANYQRIGQAARVFVEAISGGAPLKLFWNEAAGDHLTVATQEGEADAFARGYQFEGSQGFVWTDPHPGAVALEQYRNGAHSWLVASPAEEAHAKAQGFVFVRIEGYAPAP
ncbi:MAG TPA: hypothetical protein VG166_02520 [Caulobacteraceae bacterium]|nr:hypothetical protein [Caulobacteraceae bacterium]